MILPLVFSRPFSILLQTVWLSTFIPHTGGPGGEDAAAASEATCSPETCLGVCCCYLCVSRVSRSPDPTHLCSVGPMTVCLSVLFTVNAEVTVSSVFRDVLFIFVNFVLRVCALEEGVGTLRRLKACCLLTEGVLKCSGPLVL